MSIRPCDKTSKTKPQRFWDALGPFPRSVWIHPCTPEDSLDRACGNILKRYVLASKGVWPHLPENAHVFADEDGDIQSYTSRGHDGSLSTQDVNARRYGRDPDMEQQWKVSPTKCPVLYRNGSWPVVTAGQLFPVVPSD
ncbi:hypothetical protein ROHU_020934 [Labeo rohita]|uniref:Uncharacterized protein n=1 Tax=Labeo rohita TaxID=84645 RepID=A0A498NB44_LABRO|nr:hypothetical protein ROHU_020934 [Labeo rohita]